MIEIKQSDILSMAQLPARTTYDRLSRGQTEITMRDGTHYLLGAGPFYRDKHGRYRGLQRLAVTMNDGERIVIKTTIKITRAAA